MAFMGRYNKRSVPMWTPFVWLSEGTNSVRGHRGAQLPALPARHAAAARGVNLLAATSARVYLDTTDITEFDCVHIGDHSELNALACPQTLFEDRVMKIDHVRIGQPARDHGSRSAVQRGGDDAPAGRADAGHEGRVHPRRVQLEGCPAAPERLKCRPGGIHPWPGRRRRWPTARSAA
jgi:hypothetical protein